MSGEEFHDPTSWILNGETGWRNAILEGVEQQPLTGFLALSPLPASIPPLTDEGGSFGGLSLPTNVAPAADGSIYLLDRSALVLKWFDPCACTFRVVPCLGGKGSGARQLRAPHGIGIRRDKLFVCDTGNHRLSVFSLCGFALCGEWDPPAAATPHRWRPFDLAFDRRGRLFVSDTANACIHRFGPRGRWQTSFPTAGTPQHLAMDCRDLLYVVNEGIEDEVQVLDGDGQDRGTAQRADLLAPWFPPLPFVVDRDGKLHLGPLCLDAGAPGRCCRKEGPAPEPGVFDLNGNPATAAPPAPPAYLKQGVYYSQALDSALYRCQWHRAVLHADIPPGSRVQLCTYTAEALLADDEIRNLPEQVWETRQMATEPEQGEWDCLVRNGGGRYLWLRLNLRGNGKATPLLKLIVVEFPRVTLRRYLPAVFGMEPVSADFTDRFLALFDTTLRSVESKVDKVARYFDPASAPAVKEPRTGADFLSWLASWIGVSLDRHWPEAKRRRFLARAGRLFDQRGTRLGLWRQLLLLLDMEPEQHACRDSCPKLRCRPAPLNCSPPPPPCPWEPPALILEHYQLRRWLFLGEGTLGNDAILWGKKIVNRSQLGEGARVGHTQLKTTPDPYRDPFHVYAHKFTVFVPARYGKSEQARKSLENLLKAESPAHTAHQVVYVEPAFRVGVQSMIGFDTVIAKTPPEMVLNETRLGQTVLNAAQPCQGGPSFQVGTTRIGTATRLD